MFDQPVVICWFRRDLRLEDNVALYHAHKSGYKVVPVFIFDTDILDELEPNDARVTFIHETLCNINNQLQEVNSGILAYMGKPDVVWSDILKKYRVKAVLSNRDYEPHALKRDERVKGILSKHGVEFHQFKDHVIQEPAEVVKEDQSPYTVYTPYKNKWINQLTESHVLDFTPEQWNWANTDGNMPDLESMGFKRSSIPVKPARLEGLDNYKQERDFPGIAGTSNLSPHLRFGLISVRKVVRAFRKNETLLSEVIWREFFQQILSHFPTVVTHNFKRKYDKVSWRNNKAEFDAWCNGKTGYPLVDAGMRELNTTGYMHNRVRMITAGFLCKHLLIDWRWGEAYFAKKLLDYELASNNGNWQWSAGTGCDAAPYFRIFNPETQLKKFDPKLNYVKKWIPEWGTLSYPAPIVDHKAARERALKTYRKALE